MKSIEVRNVNWALQAGLLYLRNEGEREESRNGPVVVAPVPVTTTYSNPTERVLFSAARDANPFFHLFESLWMLAGRNDAAWPVYFNSQFKNYSDDGKTFHGAYGYRWRQWFGYDQLKEIAHELRRDPSSRRCVLTMWDGTRSDGEEPDSDLDVAIAGGKDVPCNTQAYFDCRGGRLNMTVCCRSNDALWGAYGANAVHFSMLLELMAAWVGIPVGVYRQMSNNFHCYPATMGGEDRWTAMTAPPSESDYYCRKLVEPFPLVRGEAKDWLRELDIFMTDPMNAWPTTYSEPFFPDVAIPLYRAYEARKTKTGDGLMWVSAVKASDWKLAATQWILRREAQKGTAANV